MLVTLFASCCWAFYAYRLGSIQRRLSAIAQIERDAGWVTFRNEDGGLVDEVTDEVRRHARVDSIYLAGSKLAPRTLELLPSLDDVHFVSFNSSGFTDRHVAALDELTALRELQLNGTLITGRGLMRLANRHRLTILTLNDTSIDDGAVDTLAAMKSLRKLHVNKTRLSEGG